MMRENGDEQQQPPQKWQRSERKKNIKLRSAECWNKKKKQKAKSCKTVAYSIYDLYWIEYVLREASTTAEAKHDENLCYKHQPM